MAKNHPPYRGAANGDMEAFEESPPRLPRIPTFGVWEAIESGSGPVYVALLERVMRLNLGVNQETAERGLRELLGPQTVEHVFEDPRTLKVVPDVVTVGGRVVKVLLSDPEVLMKCMVAFEAGRAAMRRTLQDPDKLARLRADFAAEGGDPDKLTEFLLERERRRRYLTSFGAQAVELSNDPEVRSLLKDIESLRSQARQGCMLMFLALVASATSVVALVLML